MIILEKLFKLLRPLQRYILFILQIVGWIVVICLLVLFILTILQLKITDVHASFGDFVLLITAAFILAYTYEAKKMREEIVFQREMASAVDINFSMSSGYKLPLPGNTFGTVSTTKGLNSVSGFSFLSGVMITKIGRCSPFINVGNALRADYFIETEKGLQTFMRALSLQDGEIRARIWMTNGTKFIYTFVTSQRNWKKTIKGVKDLDDQLILIKKELDEP